jgi:CubicO group peptidase (beta-lactamase class C family)
VTGGFVMEAVARRAAGRSLREVLATDIKRPLGVTWLDFGAAPDDVARVALNVETGLPLGPAIGTALKRAIGKSWGPVLRMSNDERFLGGVIPSGNAIVSARDVATFYQCLLDGGVIGDVRVFEQETVDRATRRHHDDLPIDRMLGLPMSYSPGFMLGTDSFSLFGWNHPRAFGHLGLSNLFTWADPDRELVVALLTTGKPVLGTHLLSLPKLIATIHEEFPDLTATSLA